MKVRIKLTNKLWIDLWKLIVSRLLIQANSGGGKSWATRWLLEQTHGKVQQIVIDPEGEFSTLREKFDYILAGKDGDVPADPRVAGKLAERLLETGVSAIIDLYELSPADRKRFVRLFFEAMINAPKKLWHPVLVVLDEAHKFAPEKEESEAREAVIDMASRGRKRGYCLVPATQRPAKLSKDVAAECNNKLIGRASLDIDRKRSAEELGFNTKEEILSLRNLEPGEFYVFGPAISKDVEKITIGEVVTSHPKAGGKIGKRRMAKPSAGILKVLGKLADLPKEAQEEAHTLAELRAENVMLKRDNAQLKRQPKALPPEQQAPMGVSQWFNYGKKYKYTDFFEQQAKQNLLKEIEPIQKAMEQIQNLSRDALKRKVVPPIFVSKGAPIIKGTIEPGKIIVGVDLAHPKSRDKTVSTTIEHKADGTMEAIDVQDAKLGQCERKIYSFLFANQGRSFTKNQVAAVTGYSPRSGGFNNALSKLNTLGMISRESGKLSIASVSMEHQAFLLPGESFDPSPEFWKDKLGKCEREIYELLWANPNESYTKEELSQSTATVYSAGSGGFNNALSHLNTIGLIRRDGGKIKLNPEITEI